VARPGVMLYFDMRSALDFLTIEEKGQLFQAIFDYAEFGTVPGFVGSLGIAWSFIRPMIDRDEGKYENKVSKARYAVFVREFQKQYPQKDPPSFEKWAGGHHTISNDIERYPTTTPTTTTTTTPTTNTNTTATGRALFAADFSLTADSMESNGSILERSAGGAATAEEASANEQGSELGFDMLKTQAIQKLKEYPDR